MEEGSGVENSIVARLGNKRRGRRRGARRRTAERTKDGR
jgi:hypothetical protein